MNKLRWFDVAQVFDTWRVVPRVVLFGYATWVIRIIDQTLAWYEHLPAVERTLEASGMATAIISVITGLFPWVYKIYSDNANDWSPQPSRTSISQVTTEVTK